MKKTNISFDREQNLVYKEFAPGRDVFFNNEVTCLKILKENFEKKYYNIYPFPVLKKINYSNLSFSMSYCGNTIDEQHDKGIINNIEIQLENIFYNLKKNNILYKDIHPSNICINNNTIYIIDFEVAFIMDYEKYDGVITFERKGYKWSEKFYNQYYVKPADLNIYDKLNFENEKRDWKGKPWSIHRMCII